MKYFKKNKLTRQQLRKLMLKHNPNYLNEEKLHKAYTLSGKRDGSAHFAFNQEVK